ncbi:MAG: hypothetical protein L0Z70_13495 [Chloroflexi bacterium]|nr:hypothetical protein [Chloroflexota bacterium]
MKTNLFEHFRDYDISDLEGRLRGVFRPVAPRADFARGLKSRLMTERQAKPREQDVVQPALFVGLLGFVSAVLMAAVSIRAFVALFSGLLFLIQFRRQAAQEIRRA